MKEKIEDKLQYIKDAGFELTDYETVDMLSTLIQEERKDLEKYLAKVIKQLEEEEKELCKAFRKIDELENRLKIESLGKMIDSGRKPFKLVGNQRKTEKTKWLKWSKESEGKE